MLIILLIYQLTLCYAVPHRDAWEKFKETYEKHYDTIEEENQKREIFYENMNIIEKHNVEFNAGLVSFEMGMNQYGDMTQKEFERIMLGINEEDRQEENYETEGYYIVERKSFFEYIQIKGLEMRKAKQALLFIRKFFYRIYEKMMTGLTKIVDEVESWQVKESVNWLDAGAVTPSRDQGFCGSCWAFCILGSLESHRFLKYGNLAHLSVQQLIDCTKGNSTLDNHGCSGGTMDVSLEYIIQNGISLEKDYPYEEKESTCKYEKGMSAGSCRDYAEMEGENDIKHFLAERGPLCTVMDASTIQFRFYKSGLYESFTCSDSGTNHAILVIGYGESDNGGYWLIKNSWGTAWGMNGTARISRANPCGIDIYGILPIV